MKENMYIRNCTSRLIIFAYWDRRHPPAVGREEPACRQAGKTETTMYQFGTNYILVFFAYWQRSG